MNLKIHLKKVKGRFYMSLGCKGYKSNHTFNEALSKWIKGDEGCVTFTDERTEDSVYKVNVRKQDDYYIMDLFDVNSGELQVSQEQCSKIFQDYDIAQEFYINYNPKW